MSIAMGLWGDFEVTKLFDGRGALSRMQVQQRLKTEMENQAAHGVQYWPIFLLETGAHVGCAGLRPYDLNKGIYEIDFHIRSDKWRQGYALEAARAVIEHGFHTLNATALFAGHNPKNNASRALLTRLSFEYTHDEFYEPTGLMHPSYCLKTPAV